MDLETRRKFLKSGSLTAASVLAVGTSATAKDEDTSAEKGQDPTDQQKQHDKTSDHQKHSTDFPRDHPGASGPVGSESDRGKLVPGLRDAGESPLSVETPDLPKLAWEMKDGVKEFHLHAKHTRREFLPDMWFDVWGYNDSMPGPMIEAVEGDRVRIIVHNELPESTTVHWHGLEVPNRMDGVHGLNQDPIKPGESFVYEFELHQNGTFFYHSHGPMQEGMGMAGLFIIHPKTAHEPAVDHDFALMVQEWAILPSSTIPNTMSMEFNFFTINGRSAPYITPLVVRLGSRVRIRFVNMSAMDHHPMHMHGHTFWITGTEAGRIPHTAWIPSNNVLVGVAQARDIEFIANNPGDWMIHCHMFHHMMNHMTSMVGPMAHEMNGMPAGGDMSNSLGMITRGPALASDHGAHLGRGMGEMTGVDRGVRNGPFTMISLNRNSATTQPVGAQATAQHQHGQPGHQKHAGTVAHEQPDPRSSVPGYPQDMMDMHGMHPPEHIAKFNKPQTRGMRRDWHSGVEGLMTVIRVLPPDLYDKVISGDGEIPDGASVPGSEPSKERQ